MKVENIRALVCLLLLTLVMLGIPHQALAKQNTQIRYALSVSPFGEEPRPCMLPKT